MILFKNRNFIFFISESNPRQSRQLGAMSQPIYKNMRRVYMYPDIFGIHTIHACTCIVSFIRGRNYTLGISNVVCSTFDKETLILILNAPPTPPTIQILETCVHLQYK